MNLRAIGSVGALAAAVMIGAGGCNGHHATIDQQQQDEQQQVAQQQQDSPRSLPTSCPNGYDLTPNGSCVIDPSYARQQQMQQQQWQQMQQQNQFNNQQYNDGGAGNIPAPGGMNCPPDSISC